MTRKRARKVMVVAGVLVGWVGATACPARLTPCTGDDQCANPLLCRNGSCVLPVGEGEGEGEGDVVDRDPSLGEGEGDGEGDPSLLGWWGFDDVDPASGTVADQSGHGHSGLVTGGVFVPGVIGVALDASPDRGTRVDVPTFTTDLMGAASFTVFFCFEERSAVGITDTPVSAGGFGPGVAGFDVELGAEGWHASVADDADGPTAVTFASSSPAGMHCYALVVDRDRASARAYVDGTVVDAADLVVGSVASATSLTLASRAASDTQTDGVLDEVRIYARALTPVELALLP